MNDLTKHYQELFSKYGDDSRALQHADEESQTNRFKELLKEIPQDKKASFIDFGCGLGHLANYLDEKELISDYHGIDIVPEFIEHAAKKFSQKENINFHLLNILKDEPQFSPVDYVLVSGTYNNKMDNNEEFLFSSLEKLFKLTKKTMAINLLSSYVDYKDDSLFYIDPKEVFDFAKKLTPLVTLRHDYSLKEGSFPYEYTVHFHKRGQ